jgi:hypothetical protein
MAVKSFERIYSKLMAGKKGHPKSEAWFAQKLEDRKNDPLLYYIHRSRNADEHTLAGC